MEADRRHGQQCPAQRCWPRSRCRPRRSHGPPASERTERLGVAQRGLAPAEDDLERRCGIRRPAGAVGVVPVVRSNRRRTRPSTVRWRRTAAPRPRRHRPCSSEPSRCTRPVAAQDEREVPLMSAFIARALVTDPVTLTFLRRRPRCSDQARLRDAWSSVAVLPAVVGVEVVLGEDRVEVVHRRKVLVVVPGSPGVTRRAGSSAGRHGRTPRCGHSWRPCHRRSGSGLTQRRPEAVAPSRHAVVSRCWARTRRSSPVGTTDHGMYGRPSSACAASVVRAGTSRGQSRHDADGQPADARTRGLHEHFPSPGCACPRRPMLSLLPTAPLRITGFAS